MVKMGSSLTNCQIPRVRRRGRPSIWIGASASCLGSCGTEYFGATSTTHSFAWQCSQPSSDFSETVPFTSWDLYPANKRCHRWVCRYVVARLSSLSGDSGCLVEEANWWLVEENKLWWWIVSLFVKFDRIPQLLALLPSQIIYRKIIKIYEIK
jgi:hypothetical protein